MIELRLHHGCSVQLGDAQLRIQVADADTAADPAATDLLQQLSAHLARQQILHAVGRGDQSTSVTIPLPRRA